MNPIRFECPHCREIITGDESQYGQQVKCTKCQTVILAPSAPVSPAPQTARLIPNPAGRTMAGLAADASVEADVFTLSPTARAFSGQILLGVVMIGLAIFLTTRTEDFTWAPPVAKATGALGVVLLLLVWIKVKSSSYRLTNQRLFVHRGWLAKHVDELELYRVKDVVVDQGITQRLLGYGTITVLADDDSTPTMELVSISSPTKIKELIRTQYRAARQREGVRPTEFMRSP